MSATLMHCPECPFVDRCPLAGRNLSPAVEAFVLELHFDRLADDMLSEALERIIDDAVDHALRQEQEDNQHHKHK